MYPVIYAFNSLSNESACHLEIIHPDGTEPNSKLLQMPLKLVVPKAMTLCYQIIGQINGIASSFRF
jgi:hypothetical protein